MTEIKPAAPLEARASLARVFDELWNKGDVDVLDEIMESGFIGHGPGEERFTKSGLRARVLHRREAMPDLRYQVLRYVIELPWAATMWTGVGTPVQASPSGKTAPVFLSGITMWRLSDSRIAEAWVLGFDGPSRWELEPKAGS